MPYGNQDGPKMESAKQEKYDLLHDNPVAKDASGGRPWIAKHFKSSMSPLKEGHEGSPAEKELVGNQKNLNPGLRAAIEAAPEMNYGDGPEMGHPDSPAEAHCMGPRMEKGSALPKEFSVEEAKKRMEERKRKK
tara:strand:- start:924 stop:1325 length:402 start_codon:yes stop_codon:yes gene_type:complete